MKTSTLTIRLDEDLDRLLKKASKRLGKNRRIMPFAEARGFLTDEDITSELS
jgi:hypothetical protein